ncbi:MAG: cytochrome C551 [Chloroflexi bacterium]|nr:MAG: cytochrome C551 [Chloroflexota bacterium]TMG06345.1 MAG: cytochrome C551 [Chloroflexota bacterium]
MGFQARDLDCCDCDQLFAFSREDQGLCHELGYEQPRRCPACRRALESSRIPVPIAARPA